MIGNTDQRTSLCVEVCVEDATWIEDLPPVPADHHVSVSFDSSASVARDRRAVEELGYVCVGVGAVRHVSDVAHLLVAPDIVEAHTRWWRTMLDLAQRVYDLRFGPVQMALRDVLVAHHGELRNAHADRPATTGPGRDRPTA